jgi:phospholipid transport system substrate-binding protein
MISRRTLILRGAAALVAGAFSPVSVAANRPDSAPAEFVASLGNQAFGVIRGGYSIEQKLGYFHLMLQQDFDIPGSAPFILGPYWRSASPAERAEFTRLLEDFIVATFGRRLADYGGQALQVTGVRNAGSQLVVTSDLLRAGAAPVKMDWVLIQGAGVYRVGDIVVDGISMRVSLRSDIAALLNRSGTIPGLLDAMRQMARR